MTPKQVEGKSSYNKVAAHVAEREVGGKRNKGTKVPVRRATGVAQQTASPHDPPQPCGKGASIKSDVTCLSHTCKRPIKLSSFCAGT